MNKNESDIYHNPTPLNLCWKRKKRSHGFDTSTKVPHVCRQTKVGEFKALDVLFKGSQIYRQRGNKWIEVKKKQFGRKVISDKPV